MKIARSGVVTGIKFYKRRKPTVRVTTDLEGGDVWAKAPETPPLLGEKVVVIYDQSKNVWTIAA